MAVDQPKVIDFISRNKKDEIVLTISDHLDWDDTQAHLVILQDKINSYLAFLESGEIYEKYPDAKGRRQRIEITFKYAPNQLAYSFLTKATPIIEEAGFSFGFKVFLPPG
jgi:hypothetical protein